LALVNSSLNLDAVVSYIRQIFSYLITITEESHGTNKTVDWNLNQVPRKYKKTGLIVALDLQMSILLYWFRTLNLFLLQAIRMI